MTSHRRAIAAVGVAALAGTLFFTGEATAKAGGSWSISTVLGGLKSPRGIAFGNHQGMFIAESGLPGPGAQGVTRTGAVDKYVLSGTTASLAWSTTFNSLYTTAHGPADVEGPEGLSTSGCNASGGSCEVLMIMSASQRGVAAGGGPTVSQIGHLYTLDSSNGGQSTNADVGNYDYNWTKHRTYLFPSDFPDANPYGVLGGGSGGVTYVVDAGSNTVDAVTPNGHISVIAYIPNETPAPNEPSRDATPTCAAFGPDGDIYVGTLDLARNLSGGPQGQSHVYRIDPRQHPGVQNAAQLWASGVTTVTSCTFDNQGNFWATEIFQFNSQGPPGDVVSIPFNDPTAISHVGGGSLPFPGGIAQGPDGAMYVTINSTGSNAANGAVERLSQH